MIKYTREQFKNLYGDAGLQAFNTADKIETPTEPSWKPKALTQLEQSRETFKQAASSYIPGLVKTYAGAVGLDSETGKWGKPDFIKAAESSKSENPIVQMGEGALRSTASLLNVIFAPMAQAISSVTEASTENPSVQAFATENPIGSTLADMGQKIDTWKQENPEMATNIESALAILLTAAGGGELNKPVSMPKPKASFTGPTVEPRATTISPMVVSGGRESITRIPTQGISSGIMDRVARLKPTDMNKFEKMTGKTPGQYLTETGNFGSPETVIANESIKYTKSKAAVDAEMAKLPGVYKNGVIDDALASLMEKAKSVSTENVPATYRQQVADWIRKSKEFGLTMDEINAVKRLYEREVKLGYNKLLNPEKVQQATNIDNALRTWQIKQAKDLGFSNVAEMNKQTQASRFMVDKLGEQVIGQNALNSINLTDWIVLGGGTPEAVGAFLTKKFFSSRAVQAKIAEILNAGEATTKQLEAKIKYTPERVIRSEKGFEQGMPKMLPEGQTKVPTGTAPIQLRGPSTIEPAAQKIGPRTSIQSTTQQLPQSQGIKGKTPSANNIPIKRKVQIGKQKTSLLQEAKKYKSAEEFADNMMYHGTAKSNIKSILEEGLIGNRGRIGKYKGNEVKYVSFADEPNNALNFATGRGEDAGMVIAPKPSKIYELGDIRNRNTNKLPSATEWIKKFGTNELYWGKPEAKQFLKSKGYDAISFMNPDGIREIRILGDVKTVFEVPKGFLTITDAEFMGKPTKHYGINKQALKDFWNEIRKK